MKQTKHYIYIYLLLHSLFNDILQACTFIIILGWMLLASSSSSSSLGCNNRIDVAVAVVVDVVV